MKEQFGFPNTICDKPSMQIISSHSICHTLCLNYSESGFIFKNLQYQYVKNLLYPHISTVSLYIKYFQYHYVKNSLYQFIKNLLYHDILQNQYIKYLLYCINVYENLRYQYTTNLLISISRIYCTVSLYIENLQYQYIKNLLYQYIKNLLYQYIKNL